jgi:uncharacterized membrane protein YbhN (UPF0104 family)
VRFAVSQHHLGREAPALAGLVAAAAALFVAAGAGMSYVAGFHPVWNRFEHIVWWWLLVAIAFVGLSFVGYYFGYRGVGKVDGGPDDLSHDERLAAVAAGFGGFLAQGGSALDEVVMRAAGASEREAKVRVTLLGGLEHATVTVPGTAAAIVVLAEGLKKPGLDFSVPWVIGPAIGFAIAFYVAARYRAPWRRRDGWRGKASVLLDAIQLIRKMATRPRSYGLALGGMILFWLCDMFALWACLAAFRFRMNGAAEVVAFATAMIVTRRTGPLGGAGILMCALPPTLWQAGALWPPAVAATIAWRFFTLWLPMPFSFLALPTLRSLADRTRDTPQEGTHVDKKEPALQH